MCQNPIACVQHIFRKKEKNTMLMNACERNDDDESQENLTMLDKNAADDILMKKKLLKLVS